VPGCRDRRRQREDRGGLDDAEGQRSPSATEEHTDEGPTRLFRRPRLTLRGSARRHRDTLGGLDARATSSGASRPGSDVTASKRSRYNDRPVERAEAGQRVRVALPRGFERAQLRTRRRAHGASAPTVSYRLRRRPRARWRAPPRRPAPPRNEPAVARASASASVMRSFRIRRRSWRRAADRVISARDDSRRRPRPRPASAPACDAGPHGAAREAAYIARSIHAPVKRRRAGAAAAWRGWTAPKAGNVGFARAWLDELPQSWTPGSPGPIHSTRARASRRAVARARATAPVRARGRSSTARRCAELGSGAERRRVEAELGLEPVKVETAAPRYLESRPVVRVGDGLAVSAPRTPRPAPARRRVHAAGRITLARFRDLIGAGRRTAQLLLERMDADASRGGSGTSACSGGPDARRTAA